MAIIMMSSKKQRMFVRNAVKIARNARILIRFLLFFFFYLIRLDIIFYNIYIF